MFLKLMSDAFLLHIQWPTFSTIGEGIEQRSTGYEMVNMKFEGASEKGAGVFEVFEL